MALDIFGIHPNNLEQKRRREAMATAVNEFKEEKADSILKETQSNLSKNVENIMDQERDIKRKKRA